MAEIIRATGFTNNLQRLVMPVGFSANVVAYLWGGGGGGGGNDSHPGGNGCGAMCTVQSFTVSPGDVIDIAVGGGGQHGGSGAGQGSGPGIPGAGYTVDNTLFTTLDLLGPGISRSTNNVYPTFLNTYGVWGGSSVFDQTVNVEFPSTAVYTFTGTCDNYFTVYVDGIQVLTGNNWQSIYNSKVPIPAGTHTVRILGNNISGPASIAVTIVDNTIIDTGSYCGGFGGTAGPRPFSGAGGAGGGATLLFKNSTLLAVAGGGAGGGGGGNFSNGQNAPGNRGQEAGTTAGQNGTNKPNGDGGGGGGGGGGYNAGNGGTTPTGDNGGYSGMYGGSLGDVTYLPNALKPGGAALARYNGAGGQGGVYTISGNPGYAVLVFEPTSYQVKFDGDWAPVKKAYIKVNGTWKESRNVFVKSNGTWTAIIGSSDDYAPALSVVPGYFGTNPRPGVGGGGGGGGGGKIICTKLYELGLMSKDIYEADQAFGAELVQVRPDIYNGYRAWAEIVVDWMSGGGPKMMPWMTDEEFSTAAAKWSTTWAQDIATPWAEEMAYRVGRKQQGSRTGRMIMTAGIPICKAVGVWQRWFGASKKPAGFGKGLMLIPVFVMFKLVAELGRLIERK